MECQVIPYVSLRDDIRQSLLDSLAERGLAKQPFLDLVEQYMNMWDTSWMLDRNIKENGVMIDAAGTGNLKKNECVALLININKQMNVQLDKLGIEAHAKKSVGRDV